MSHLRKFEQQETHIACSKGEERPYLQSSSSFVSAATASALEVGLHLVYLTHLHIHRTGFSL